MFAKTRFSITANEKSSFCGVLKKAKLPDGCATNISRHVKLSERKFYGYKSHDAHIKPHYLLHVAIRSTMSNQVSHLLIRLCSFLCCLCQKLLSENILLS